MGKKGGRKAADQGKAGGSQADENRHLFKIKREYVKTLQRKKEKTRSKPRRKRSINKWLKCDICPQRFFRGWSAVKRHKETYHCMPALFPKGYIEVFEENTSSVKLSLPVKKVKVERKMMNLETGNLTRKNWATALKTSIRYIVEKAKVKKGASITEIEYVLMLMYFKNFEYFRQKAGRELLRLLKKGMVTQKPDADGCPGYFLADEAKPDGPRQAAKVQQPEDSDDDD